MKRYVWYIAAAIVAAIATGAVVLYLTTERHADPNKIRMAVDADLPPFAYVEADGVFQGFDVDVAHALCERMRIECRIVALDRNGPVDGLLDGTYDAIVASVVVTAEQADALVLTKAYRVTPSRFVQRKGTGHELTKAGLAGKAIGVQASTAHEDFVRSRFGDVATVSPYPTLAEALKDIAAGRIDLIFADGFALGEGFLKSDSGADFEFVGPSFTDAKWFGDGVRIVLRKADEDLRRRLDKAIDAIHDDGAYRRIREQHFPAEIYGD